MITWLFISEQVALFVGIRTIVAEHVEFKPNLKGKDGDGKDEEGAVADAVPAEEAATGEAELKEAANF